VLKFCLFLFTFQKLAINLSQKNSLQEGTELFLAYLTTAREWQTNISCDSNLPSGQTQKISLWLSLKIALDFWPYICCNFTFMLVFKKYWLWYTITKKACPITSCKFLAWLCYRRFGFECYWNLPIRIFWCKNSWFYLCWSLVGTLA